MCGFAGIVKLDPSEIVEEARLKRMRDVENALMVALRDHLSQDRPKDHDGLHIAAFVQLAVFGQVQGV